MTTNAFPAKVVIGHKEWPTARIRTDATEQRLQVWVVGEGYPRQPICVADAYIVETITAWNKWAPTKVRKAEWVLSDGTTISAQALAGCGCSSPLKQLPRWRQESQQVQVISHGL